MAGVTLRTACDVTYVAHSRSAGVRALHNSDGHLVNSNFERLDSHSGYVTVCATGGRYP